MKIKNDKKVNNVIRIIFFLLLVVFFICTSSMIYNQDKYNINMNESDGLKDVPVKLFKIGNENITDLEYDFLYYQKIYTIDSSLKAKDYNFISQNFSEKKKDEIKINILSYLADLYGVRDYITNNNLYDKKLINEEKEKIYCEIFNKSKTDKDELDNYLKRHYGEKATQEQIEGIVNLEAEYNYFYNNIRNFVSKNLDEKEYKKYYLQNLNFLNSLDGMVGKYTYTEETREKALEYANNLYDTSNSVEKFKEAIGEQAEKLQKDEIDIKFDSIVYSNTLIYETQDEPIIYKWLINIEVDNSDKLGVILEDKDKKNIYVVYLNNITYNEIFTKNIKLIEFDENNNSYKEEQKEINKLLNNDQIDIDNIKAEYKSIKNIKNLNNFNCLKEFSSSEEVIKFLKIEENSSIVCDYKENPCIFYIECNGESIVMNCYLSYKENELIEKIKARNSSHYSNVYYYN